MTAVNDNALPIVAGKLYVADHTTVTQLLNDMSNASTVKTELDALTYTRLASITDLAVVENLSNNLVEVETDDTGTIYKATRPDVNVTGNWFELVDPAVIEKILGQSVLNVAGTPVAGATQTITSGTKAFNEFVAIENQNGDGSAITVNSVTGATDGALVADTDYVVTNVDGVYGVLIVDSVTVTTMAQDFTINYDYTPNASKLQGRTIESFSIPKLIIKIVAVNSAGETNTYYLYDCGLESDLTTSFIDVTRAGDITPTAFDFAGNKQGFILKSIESL